MATDTVVQTGSDRRGDAARTVASVLRAGVQSSGERRAIVSEGLALTRAEVLTRAESRLAQLRNAGVAKGDALLVMLENGLDFVETWLAAAIGGVVEVPVNTEFRGEMLRYIIRDSGASVIVMHAQFLPRLVEIATDDVGLERVVIVGDGEGERDMAGLAVSSIDSLDQSMGELTDEDSPSDQDPIGVLYTSGTTGPAKGTLISHRHAYQYAHALIEMLELAERDVYYAPLPLFHIAGQWAIVYATLISGCTVVLKRRFSVKEFWEDCREHGVTVSFLLGAMAHFLDGQDPRADDSNNPVERIVMVPLIEGLANFKRRFGVAVTTCYGSTETGVPIIGQFANDDPAVAGTVRPGYELRLVDEDDEQVPTGQVGELVVRADEPWVTMIEYRGKPEATANALRNLWLHSGDAMRRDEDGVYYFVDRINDTLRRRGENVSSFEVEREVYAYPSVLECAAIGVPSEYTEEDLVVVVVSKPQTRVDEHELREFLRERTPRFMVPDRVIVLETMPKTPTGKIQKQVLREQVVGHRVPSKAGH